MHKINFSHLCRIYCIFGFRSGLKGSIEALIEVAKIQHQLCCFPTFASIWKDKRRDAKMIVTTDCSYLHLKLESITSLHEKNHVLFWNSWRPMRNSLFASQLYLNFSRNFYQIALCLDPKQSWSNQNTKKSRILAAKLNQNRTKNILNFLHLPFSVTKLPGISDLAEKKLRFLLNLK